MGRSASSTRSPEVKHASEQPQKQQNPCSTEVIGSCGFYHFRRLCFDDGHSRVPQALAKGRAHRVVGAANNEVDDLHGGEDNAQALAHAREGLGEEAIVERALRALACRARTVFVQERIQSVGSRRWGSGRLSDRRCRRDRALVGRWNAINFKCKLVCIGITVHGDTLLCGG